MAQANLRLRVVGKTFSIGVSVRLHQVMEMRGSM